MSRVYLVTSGVYSDYSVDAVFTTRELAEEFLSRRASEEKYYGGSVEEWDADLPRDQQPGAFCCWMYENGTVAYEYYSSLNTAGRPPEQSTYQYKRIFQGYGTSAEHARRAAEEHRSAVLMLEG